ncbi:hypothetical protein Q9Q99_11175 [Curtobacterium flaccumfaciens]|nr:hypothetical protein Q9Q99_11175 [Curtobacterium flaccumfaciens]
MLDLDGLAGADWLIVPLPEEVRGKPKRWANSTTYRLFPWYVRPFRSVDVIMTAGKLQNSCEMSTPDLRFWVLPSADHFPDEHDDRLRHHDGRNAGRSRTPPVDSLRAGTASAWEGTAETWPFLDATGAVVARRWRFPLWLPDHHRHRARRPCRSLRCR